ncbi:hypothetical protein HGP16_06765 [Rhizobium sp. P40RR-XXII]|uniref:hypothetical protein n=1 Tax=unclassified Rhizobium TaxID=2613769 RepID=UPI001456CF84|nr:MULTISPECIES: hypothetical protein [unclassified Rhizobium]NLR84834.1 hypothetical protein [Rhizobium sp. P28RR-XV]NLS16259.1 hypothetical protein [Rhizobium sp. P40RR-XXII]
MTDQNPFRLILICAALFAPVSLSAQEADEAVKGLLKVLDLDQAGEAMISYCETAAPATAPRLKEDWQRWRERAEVEKAMAAIGGAQVKRIRDMTRPTATRLVDEIKQRGAAAEHCPDLSSWLNQGPFDTRKAFPAYHARLKEGGQFALAPASGTSPSSPSTAAGTADAAMIRGNVRVPGATFYTPTQLQTLFESWWGPSRDLDRARRSMAAAMPLIIQGKLVRYGDAFFLEDNDGIFRSKQRVSLSLADSALAPYEGKIFTVRGHLNELPGALVFLYGVQTLDPAGLVPSDLPIDGGRVRLNARADQVMAVAGGGIASAQIHGVLYNSYRDGDGQFVEDVLLLLKDGSYYRGRVAPSRLDLAKSRRMQPQLWGKWRMQGSGFQIQPSDDEGRPKAWTDQSGFLLSDWKHGQSITGTFTNKSFNGSIALGGVYRETSYRFTSDGRFEIIGLTRGGSGSMAAAGGFSGSATRYSDGEGSRSSAGGGNGSVFAGSRSSSDDGSADRGTFALEGYAITLRFDDGHVETLLSAPWDEARKILIDGSTYSRD